MRRLSAVFRTHCTAASTVIHSGGGQPCSFGIALAVAITSGTIHFTFQSFHDEFATQNRCCTLSLAST